MKFIDAHIHLSDSEYNGKVKTIIEDARESNVIALVSNSMNYESSMLSLQLAERNPGFVYAALGIHPWNIQFLSSNELKQTLDVIFKQGRCREKVVAIGEVGLDFSYDKKQIADLQIKVFNEMLQAAEKLSLPVIVHSRRTAPKLMSILPSFNVEKALFHWFSGPVELLPRIVENGYYVSEGPPSVYSSRTREIIKLVPLSSLLTETDGPVRFGGPFYGKMTTPSFIPQVVKAIAEIKGMKETEVAGQILQNFTDFFGVNLF
ncbi:MAG: TatD family hydrolase [Candidatus Bathyarchaeia archaeon]